jgi:hypothetical protein
MEVYLLSLPLARHRTIAARPRQGLPSSTVLGAAEPTCGGRDEAVIPTERQAFSAALQRNPR